MESLRRKTIQVNLVRIPPQLKELASRIPENSPFTERHGHLLDLVTSNTDEDMMKVLFQFFDPLHHCFTFPDYQLVPTVMRWENWLEVLHLYLQMFRFSKSRHRLFFYPKGKVKKHRKDLWDIFLSSGGSLWKGNVLAPFSSMVFHGLLVTCLDHLLLLFNCLKWCFVYGFERCFEKRPSLWQPL